MVTSCHVCLPKLCLPHFPRSSLPAAGPQRAGPRSVLASLPHDGQPRLTKAALLRGTLRSTIPAWTRTRRMFGAGWLGCGLRLPLAVAHCPAVRCTALRCRAALTAHQSSTPAGNIAFYNSSSSTAGVSCSGSVRTWPWHRIAIAPDNSSSGHQLCFIVLVPFIEGCRHRRPINRSPWLSYSQQCLLLWLGYFSWPSSRIRSRPRAFAR